MFRLCIIHFLFNNDMNNNFFKLYLFHLSISRILVLLMGELLSVLY